MIAVYFTSGQYAMEHADTVQRFKAAMNESQVGRQDSLL
jgi:hypothetical protein